ncbi:hypothetical protein ACFOLJ_21615 [Rugamonas sp. CCM 8940]|uniref:hypothetical protein n=1 Tax=Rugamonas sp. CCM 8940 TaxID=2765359 RepID=UPI0018F441AD|nr:hypothetical protein [Rugamonas sp. CCM 8940]MBJ7310709.1 hypothetical protein [Rugamonas sp. CCM 8940]
MQIAPSTVPASMPQGNTSNAVAADGTALGLAGQNAATATPVTPTPSAPAPLRRGLSNWDRPPQGDVAGAQQALDFLEQSAAQLRALKSDLSAKLADRQVRDGTIEARVRQFGSTWKQRQQTSGGTLDARLAYSRKGAVQRFTVRGMTLAGLRHGNREVLSIAVGSAAQGVRSVSLEPGLSDAEIAQRFDDALAPLGVRASVNDDGALEFATPEDSWAGVRDSFAVQGSGIRFPTGQMNRVKTEPEAASIDPDSWNTSDLEALRQTLQQVVQALAQVEQAMASVSNALSQAGSRAQAGAPVDGAPAMDQVAQNFVTTTNQSGYQSLLSLTSALVGISRERVISLLGLR